LDARLTTLPCKKKKEEEEEEEEEEELSDRSVLLEWRQLDTPHFAHEAVLC
jgi:hypothetical protein